VSASHTISRSLSGDPTGILCVSLSQWPRVMIVLDPEGAYLTPPRRLVNFEGPSQNGRAGNLIAYEAPSSPPR
jgi:hypothetical protein